MSVYDVEDQRALVVVSHVDIHGRVSTDLKRELREVLRLARGREHRTPEFAVEVEALAALRDDADGNVDELAVEKADD